MLVVYGSDAYVAISGFINQIDKRVGALRLSFIVNEGVLDRIVVPKGRHNSIKHENGNVLIFVGVFARE